jgi:hypothetical protein
MTPPKETADGQTNNTNEYQHQENRNDFGPASGFSPGTKARNRTNTWLVQIDYDPFSFGLVSFH